MAGNTALLHAACEEAKLIGYSGSMLREAEDKHLKKFSRRTSLTSLFHERNAAGARKFGAWRENPAWKVSVKKKCTLFVAVNEGGELTKEMRAKLAEMEAKEQATYGKAKDKLVAAKAAADADPKNDELAAAAQPIPGGGYCYCDPACDNDYTDNNSHGGCCADHAWRCSKDGERDPLCMDARTQAQAVNAFVAHHVVAALMNHTTASASDSEVVVLGT